MISKYINKNSQEGIFGKMAGRLNELIDEIMQVVCTHRIRDEETEGRDKVE